MYTLADFIEDIAIPELQLLTRKTEFHRIGIASVSVQELPVDGFIQKNELVLSTALGCLDDLSRFRELIRAVGGAQAAAMILAFYGDAYSFPTELIECAEQMRLPVFVIPWRYRFSEIQATVIHGIQNEKLKAYRSIQAELFDLYFDSQPLERAAERLALFFSVPVAIEDKSHRVQGASRDMRELLDAPGPRREDAFYTVEISLGHIPSGYVRACTGSPPQKNRFFEAAEQGLLEKYVCFPLSLWFNRKNIEDLVTVRLKNDFVWNLANGNYSSFEDAALQGMRLHFDLGKSYACLVMKMAPTGERAAAEAYSSQAAQEVADIEMFITETAGELGLDVMFANRELQFIIYLENAAEGPAERLNEFMDRMDSRLAGRFPACRFFWGISEVRPAGAARAGFEQLYSDASLALRYCLHAEEGRSRFTYQDTREAQIVSVLANHPEIRKAAEESMEPLLKDGFGKELLHTLTEYIANNYNTSLTARKLHLHRQSLLYRLEKIEALTRMDLTRRRDLFLLEVYTRIFSNY